MVSVNKHRSIKCKRFFQLLNKLSRIGLINSSSLFLFHHYRLFMDYSWNASLIDMTNIIWSFLAKGQIFPFRVDLDLSQSPNLGGWGQLSLDHVCISLFTRYQQLQMRHLVNNNRHDYHIVIGNIRAKSIFFTTVYKILV